MFAKGRDGASAAGLCIGGQPGQGGAPRCDLARRRWTRQSRRRHTSLPGPGVVMLIAFVEATLFFVVFRTHGCLRFTARRSHWMLPLCSPHLPPLGPLDALIDKHRLRPTSFMLSLTDSGIEAGGVPAGEDSSNPPQHHHRRRQPTSRVRTNVSNSEYPGRDDLASASLHESPGISNWGTRGTNPVSSASLGFVVAGHSHCGGRQGQVRTEAAIPLRDAKQDKSPAGRRQSAGQTDASYREALHPGFLEPQNRSAPTLVETWGGG